MVERYAVKLTKDERRIIARRIGECLEHGVDLPSRAQDAMREAVRATREHILKAFERHIGGDPTRVFVDAEAKKEFRALIEKLRRA